MNIMLLLLCCLPFCLSGVLSAATTAKTTTIDPNNNLINDLTIIGKYHKILALIGSYLPGMLTELVRLPEVTLFLPTDEAMNKVPADVMNDLHNDTQKLKDLIYYHTIVNETYRVRGADNDRVLTSRGGKPIRINLYRRPMPHTAEGVKIVQENLHIANGLVHGIDNLMKPPQGDIVTLISQRPDMKTLTSLLGKANLNDVITNDENMTFFAPTDAAFALLPSNVTHYLNTHTTRLQYTLLYHIVNLKTMYSLGMRNGMTIRTADGNHDPLMLLEDYSGHIFINRAKISERDISATNGVIHVIDDVLMPTKILLLIEQAGITVVG